MASAVYSVVQVRLDGVTLVDCFPPTKDVKAAYLAELCKKARTLESTDKPKSAMVFIKEHVRFSTLPRESLPLEGLCRLGVGQETEAKTIADTVWNSKLPGSSSFWFDLAELEYRLGREELSTRAVEKADTAWNNENWFGVDR